VGYQIWEHARIFFVPDASATVYLYANGMFSLWGSASVVGGIALLSFSVVGVFLWRFWREDCFWYLWFLIWIAAAFNVGSYGGYLMAEKALYLASLGLSVLIVRLLSSRKHLQSAGLVIIGGLFIFNSTQVYARADSWANTATYVAKILEFEPEFDLALVAGGNTAQLEGRYQDAADYYLRALRRRPDLAAYMGERYVENKLRWAEELTEQGESDQAIQALEDAVETIPGDSRIYNGMGVVYYLSGDREKARKNWNLALQFDPANFEASQNMKLLEPSR
jgi:tetratricopeptide (TPR) repeat protein